MRAKVAVLAGMCLAVPAAATAHPHVFVDASLEIIFDSAGRAEALRIGWVYDELFSMAYLAERGLDSDFDSVLTASEQAQIQGFDMNWAPGFPGDTYALLDGRPIGLSAPSDPTAVFEGNRLASTHLRRFDQAIDLTAQELIVQVYDPSFYTSYAIAGTPVLTGRTDCAVQVFEPDRAAADARLEAALAELAGSADAETDFPAIGSAYAEEARISCAR